MTPDLSVVAQQTTPEFANASSDLASSFGSSGAVLALFLVIALVIVGLISSVQFYRWALEATGRFAASIEYALKGVLTAIVIAVFAAPFYLISTIDPGTRRTVAMAVAGLLIAYGGLVILGVIGEAAWRRIVAQHEAATGRHPLERFSGDSEEASDS